jgi:hypothetical protein
MTDVELVPFLERQEAEFIVTRVESGEPEAIARQVARDQFAHFPAPDHRHYVHSASRPDPSRGRRSSSAHLG